MFISISWKTIDDDQIFTSHNFNCIFSKQKNKFIKNKPYSRRYESLITVDDTRIIMNFGNDVKILTIAAQWV